MLSILYKKKEWEEFALQLLKKYRLLTAGELIKLMKLHGKKAGRSSIYSFLKHDPSVKSSTIIRGSKIRVYRVGKPVPTEEAYSILLHNEYFIVKLGLTIPKPTTETTLEGYIKRRFDQLEEQGENASPLLKLEWGTATFNMRGQKKMRTPVAPANMYCLVKNNKVRFICFKSMNAWVIYDTPSTSKEALIRKLEMLQKSIDEDYYGDLSSNVLILSFDTKRVERFIKSFKYKAENMKISVVSPY